MRNDFRPMPSGERLVHLDVIRGFAILGIFIVNIGAFSAPYFLYGGAEKYWNTPLDRFTMGAVDILFQGSFYTLFSILFGFSWQMLKERLEQKGLDYFGFQFRRQAVLASFGVVHGLLIWHGDILLSYGLIGLLLLMFAKVENRTLLFTASIMYFGSTLLLTLASYQVRNLISWYDQYSIDQAIENYSSHNPLLIWGQNLTDWAVSHSGMTLIFLILLLLPLFLFGMYLARKRWFHEPEKHQMILLEMLKYTFILSVVFKFGPYVIGNPMWLSFLQDNIGGAASALFYMTLITLFHRTRAGKKWLQPLKYVGRMALSNYIFQSVLCFIIFYIAGFYHLVPPIISVLVALVIFAIQVVLSKWWLNRYHFGPLEWVWRSLNYKEKQPFRK